MINKYHGEKLFKASLFKDTNTSVVLSSVPMASLLWWHCQNLKKTPYL